LIFKSNSYFFMSNSANLFELIGVAIIFVTFNIAAHELTLGLSRF